MLRLDNITKDYAAGDTVVHALKGISISFRKSEFVSILGPSGCGKTTLLNIVGGLDQYTDGDLTINNVSTREYKDRDWDAYRNHSIGFVFQNYNLIMHQSVLSNVELALTLSGVSKQERRERARNALEQVGLSDQMNKKPNQLSGGQMQRVAIARAIVNEPEILLADEPTGALDTATSIQIMQILKEISNERLIIMVTHNPELAEQYSSRIIRLLDGKVTDDSLPFDDSQRSESDDKKNDFSSKTGYIDKKEDILSAHPEQKDCSIKEQSEKKKHKKSVGMSFFTALGLSTKNLLTKKTRTFLTAFAGSIGIIGIALILSLSNGVQQYIDRVQEDTLSSYPITIESETVDVSSMLSSLMGKTPEDGIGHELDKIYSSDIMGEFINTMLDEVQSNNLKEFKAYLDNNSEKVNQYVNDVQFTYNLPIIIYKEDTSEGCVQVNPSVVMDTMRESMGVSFSSEYQEMISPGMSNSNVWVEMIGDEDLLLSQYDVIAGTWPKAFNEVVLIVDENNEISDYSLYSLGLKDQSQMDSIMEDIMSGTGTKSEQVSFSYDELLNLKFRLVLSSDFYQYDEESGHYQDTREEEELLKKVVGEGVPIKITGIARPNEDAVATSVSGSIGYSSKLTEYVIEKTNESDIVTKQVAHSDVDVFTGIEFPKEGEETKISMEDVNAYVASLSEEEQVTMQGYFDMMTEEQILEMFQEKMKVESTDATYEGNLKILNSIDIDNPFRINIYAKDFDSKDQIAELISQYNKDMEEQEKKENVIQYTDLVGLIMSSVSTIINAISYILIAFVAISLVVSSIMIGIITYISVLERTKEIGILRSIGASKKDIARVFNAETMIVGFGSGVIGIGVTLILLIPANIIVKSLTSISNVAILPWQGAVILIAISIMLTLVAGLIPSGLAAKKDPVVALRSE